MRTTRSLWLAACLALAAGPALVAPEGAAAATPATVAGKLSGVRLPAGAAGGRAAVYAIDLRTGVVAGASKLGATGAFRLRLPSSLYAFSAFSLRRTGGRFALFDQPVGAAKVASGRKTSLALRKRTKARKKRRSARKAAWGVPAGFGDVDVNHPAIAIDRFTVQDGGNKDVQQLGRGVPDMLITDLVDAFDPGRCGRQIEIVERAHLDAVQGELALANSPFVDPSTKVSKGKIIKDNASITGSVSVSGGSMTLSATYTERQTGYTTTVTKSGAAGDFFQLQAALSAELSRKICKPEKPGLAPVYDGAISGRVTATNGVVTLTVSFTGSVRLAAVAGAPGSYQSTTGTGTATAKSTGGDCTLEGSGAANYGVGAIGPGGTLTFTGTASYMLLVTPDPLSTITLTRSGCKDPTQNGKTEPFSLAGYAAVRTKTPRAWPGSGPVSGTESYTETNPIGASQTNDHSWDLQPSS